MCNQADLERCAELCARMAEDDSFAGRREALQEMSLVFQQLAAEEARLETMIRDLDAFFTETDEAADSGPLPKPTTSSHLH
jgi:hypothetical protein